MTSFCEFECASERFSINISEVLDIFEVQTIYQIPKSPSYIKGLANNRGDIIPIFDIREVLSLEKKKNFSHIIVTSLSNILLGFASERCPSILTSVTFQEAQDVPIIKGKHEEIKLINVEKIIEDYKI